MCNFNVKNIYEMKQEQIVILISFKHMLKGSEVTIYQIYIEIKKWVYILLLYMTKRNCTFLNKIIILNN